MSKRVQVKIGNLIYQLHAGDDPGYVREIAQKADEMIRRVMQENTSANMNQATVLALLNTIDLDNQAKMAFEGIHEREANLIGEIKDLKAECSKLREQVWETKKDLLYFRNLCELYEDRLAGINPGGRKEARAKEEALSDSRQMTLEDFLSKDEDHD